MSGISKKVTPDYWIEENGRSYAGQHYLLDIHQSKNLDCVSSIEQALKQAVTEAGATLLHIHLHHFGPGQGVSGVAVLSESHISVHTWPERGFAAFDIFMCGHARPDLAVRILQDAFPGQSSVIKYLRGEANHARV